MNGSSPLHAACEGGHAGCVRLLLDAKADHRALCEPAAASGEDERAPQAGVTPLFVACTSYTDQPECVVPLLGARADIESTTEVFGLTPLMGAALSGHALHWLWSTLSLSVYSVRSVARVSAARVSASSFMSSGSARLTRLYGPISSRQM